MQVNHSSYGTLFSAVVKGGGKLLSSKDEKGNDLPCMTTEEILKEIQRFGFYVTYDVKSNLPMNTIAFLSTIDNLGYDKITKVGIQYRKDGEKYIKPAILVFKSEYNHDILNFECIISEHKYLDKLSANSIMDVTHEKDIQWDWVKYIANISDILEENIDPTDDFETQTDIETDEFDPYESSEIPESGSALAPQLIPHSDIEEEPISESDLIPVGYTVYGDKEMEG